MDSNTYDITKIRIVGRKLVVKKLWIRDYDTLANVIAKLNNSTHSDEFYNAVRENGYGFFTPYLEVGELAKYNDHHLLIYRNDKYLRYFLQRTNHFIPEELKGLSPSTVEKKIAEKTMLEAKEKARLEAEEKARLEAEEKARLEEEERRRQMLGFQRLLVADDKAKAKAESTSINSLALSASVSPAEDKPATPEAKAPEKSIFEIITDELDKLGIRGLVLENDSSVKNYYRDVASKGSNWSKKIGYFRYIASEQAYHYQYENDKGVLETKKFYNQGKISEGTYNKILLVSETPDPSSKSYALKIPTKADKDSQKMAFIENI